MTSLEWISKRLRKGKGSGPAVPFSAAPAVAPAIASRQTDPVFVFGVSKRTGRIVGIKKQDRLHVHIAGRTQMGKSTLLKTMIIQNMRDGDGVILIDPHGDLALQVLSHVPEERIGDVVYIDPTTRKDFGKVVKFNFLECENSDEEGMVMNTFLDSLHKIHKEFWGPRLSMCTQNAILAIFEAVPQLAGQNRAGGGTYGKKATLSDLAGMLSDQNVREQILPKVTDQDVRRFWRQTFPIMPPEASQAAQTKIYRLIQDPIITPLFDTTTSTIDFKELINGGKIVIIRLPIGKMSGDLQNFLGSMLLSRIYLAGMEREALPIEERRSCFVYVDEAPRFITDSLKDLLEAMGKYHVFVTLACQQIAQYEAGFDVRAHISELCGTQIVFPCDKDTARALEEYFPRMENGYKDLMRLAKYTFAISTEIGETRDCQVVKTVEYGWGVEDKVERAKYMNDIIKSSLEKYGAEVLSKKRLGIPVHGAGRGEAVSVKLLAPADSVSPVSWITLLEISRHDKVERGKLFETLKKDFGFTTTLAAGTVNYLVRKSDVEAQDIKTDVTDPRTRERRRKTFTYYTLTQAGRAFTAPPELFKPGSGQALAYTARGGGPLHHELMKKVVEQHRRSGFFTIEDTGDPGRGFECPDLIVYPLQRYSDGAGGETYDPKLWGTSPFAVEIETDPADHASRVVDNFVKCRRLGLAVEFVVPDERSRGIVSKLLKEAGATIVDNISEGVYRPGNASVRVVEPPKVMDEKEKEAEKKRLEEEQVRGEVGPEQAKPQAEKKPPAREVTALTNPPEGKVSPPEESVTPQNKNMDRLRNDFTYYKTNDYLFMLRKKKDTFHLTACRRGDSKSKEIDLGPYDGLIEKMCGELDIDIADIQRLKAEGLVFRRDSRGYLRARGTKDGARPDEYIGPYEEPIIKLCKKAGVEIKNE